MNDTEKIRAIKEIFDIFHNGEDDLDTIDVCMRVEAILER